MSRRIVLHIGTMKSATTHVQALCDVNRAALAKQGIWWPTSSRCFAATKQLMKRAKREEENVGAWHALAREMDATDDTVLLSNELLFGCDDASRRRVANAMKGKDVQLIVTARDLARIVPSQWQSLIRGGSGLAWSSYVEQLFGDAEADSAVRSRFWMHHNLVDGIERWTAALPQASVTLVTVPPSGGDPAVIGDRFWEALGVDHTGLSEPKGRGNASLGAYSAELLRRLNKQTRDWEWETYRQAFKRGLASGALQRISVDQPRIGVEPDAHAAIVAYATAMTARLEELDGLRVIGDIADLVPPGEPADGIDPGTASTEDLLTVASAALVGFAEEHAALRAKHDALLRRTRIEQHDAVAPPRLRSAIDRIGLKARRRSRGLARRIPGMGRLRRMARKTRGTPPPTSD